ncbi:M20/M25/M40 family metallo-hydrolase [Nocardioides bruguierae]|uniref:M20/M25/M40 family metallo-hydrolase n=1 Tax=Nocardioides bruguierae TaxID=2945102 RepID=A0A9X2D742_9ACTN|nr:M20/M25/M40 family metallo-hydrolase [Nocardioides bruguierae]MCM0620360.1 M20/M25/M40 family metallo-hydrolase [Nocardioides bruguierae]
MSSAAPSTPGVHETDEPAALAALRALVRVPTVSRRPPDRIEDGVLARLHAVLAEHFPLLHAAAEVIGLDDGALLLHWRGRSAARPVVLMAHLDVVPPGEHWTRDPFGAELLGGPQDGTVYGRGVLDDKGSVAAICSAVEELLAAGHEPAQDVWLSFGSNEEVSGTAAAAAVVELRRRGVEPWMVLDEGGAVAGGTFPGVDVPVAVIGVAEKGTTSLRLVASGGGGHASTPSRGGATARLAKAVLALERHPLPARLGDVTVETFRRLAPHARQPVGALMARAGSARPAVARALAALGGEPAALVRTTMVTTTLSGSPALNVVASEATAGVNARIAPGESVADVVAHVRSVVGKGIDVEVVESGEPSPLSPWEDEAFALLERGVAEVFPDAVTTPYVVLAATDGRFLAEICPRVYRFAPFRMSKAQRATIHGPDEHLHVPDLLDGVRFYRRLLEELPA